MACSSSGSALLRGVRVGVVSAMVLGGTLGVACGDTGGRSGNRADGVGADSGSGGDLILGSGGDLNIGASSNHGSGCNELEVDFEEAIPNVVILVDRSGSMWSGIPGSQMNYWDTLKAAVLPVVEAFQDEVRFSLSAYTSESGSWSSLGRDCPIYVESDPPALNNYASIQAAYDTASVQIHGGETPTIFAIEDAMSVLEGLGTDAGPKYILLVTDGEPDYCDDGREPCAANETVGIIQKAYDQGIGTIVVGLVPDGISPTFVENLQRFANAGAGVPVADPGQNIDWCSNGGLTHPAEYGTPTSDAPLHVPDQDSASLEDALSGIIKGVKSCVFQLDGQVTIDPDNAHLGKIYLREGEEETEVTFGDGWAVQGDSAVELLGDACSQLKAVETTGIRFDFPCTVFVVR